MPEQPPTTSRRSTSVCIDGRIPSLAVLVRSAETTGGKKQSAHAGPSTEVSHVGDRINLNGSPAVPRQPSNGQPQHRVQASSRTRAATTTTVLSSARVNCRAARAGASFTGHLAAPLAALRVWKCASRVSSGQGAVASIAAAQRKQPAAPNLLDKVVVGALEGWQPALTA